MTSLTGLLADRDHYVRELAHSIWEAEGRPDGQAQRHWDMAERLVDAQEQALHGDGDVGGMA